jgi:hypothetical protein
MGKKMTDEERKKFVDILRRAPSWALCEKAADEIERLAPAHSNKHPTQSEIEYDKRDVLRKARHYVRAVFELIQEFAHQPFILQEIDAALAIRRGAGRVAGHRPCWH